MNNEAKANMFSLTSKSANTTLYEDTKLENPISVSQFSLNIDEFKFNEENVTFEITGGSDASLFYLKETSGVVESYNKVSTYELSLYDAWYTAAGANASDLNDDGIYELELTATSNDNETIVFTVNYTFN